MKLDLIDLSNLVISNLYKEEIPLDMVDEISMYIEDTSANCHTEVYKECLKFHGEHEHFPGVSYLKASFKNQYEALEIADVNSGLKEADKVEFSLDFVKDFISNLRDESTRARVVSALSAGDFDEASLHLNKQKIEKDKDTISIFTIDDVAEEYERITSSPSGIQLGVREIDDKVNGFSYGTMNVIAAPSSNFKTTMLISALYESVFVKGFNAVLISLEGLARDPMFNLLSRHSFEMGKNIKAEDFKKGFLSDEDKNVMMGEVIEDWKKNTKGKIIAVNPSLSGFGYEKFFNWMTELDNKLGEEVDEKGNRGYIDIFAIDYIQLFKYYSVKGRSDPKILIDYYTRLFTNTCILWGSHRKHEDYRRRGLIGIMLSQINREGAKEMLRTNLGSMHYLSDSSEIEKGAHTIVEMWCNDSMKMSGRLNIQVVKNRSGRIMDEPVEVQVSPEYYKIGSEDAGVYSLSPENLSILESDDDIWS